MSLLVFQLYHFNATGQCNALDRVRDMKVETLPEPLEKRKIRAYLVLQTTLRAPQAFQRIFIGVNRRSSAADNCSSPAGKSKA